jgi:RecA-family ATPase
MRWLSGLGEDNAIVTFASDGKMHVTERFDAIANAVKGFGARLAVLDTATDLFAGNENDRHQVRRFIGLLNRLALEIGGAVLLNAHPSRTGLSSGNLDGGSTAWSNSVRSRWSLARPRGDDDAEPDTDERILTRRKANYASTGDAINLRWVNGILAPVTKQGGVFGSIRRRAVEEVFMTLLDRCAVQGQRLSDSRNSGNFAPKVFARRPDREGHNARDFEAAMVSLFAAKRIAMQTYDRRGCRCIVSVTGAP